MKFSSYLKESIHEAWYDRYLDYDHMSNLIDQITKKPTEESEKAFIELVRSNYKKCNTFFNEKIQQLKETLKTSEDISYTMYEITDLYQYAILNRIGFYQILKKHDEISAVQCLTYYSVKLSPDLFCPVDQIYLLFTHFSKRHRELREKLLNTASPEVRYRYLETQPPTEVFEKMVAGTDEKAIQDSSFVRKSEKYWILSKDLPKVINCVMKNLPLHLFNEDELIQETTSVYLDNEQFDCYRRRIDKVEGADLIRLRWYGDLKNNSKVFIEQKVHHENWSWQRSSKNRFALDKELILDFLTEKDYLLNTEVNQPETLDLVDRVKESITVQKLRPYLATKYLRFAFQDEDNDYIRISVDTNLRMIRKTGDSIDWSSTETAMKSNSVHFFPFAVMEIKLRDPFINQRPEWLTKLVDLGELIPTDGFSKYQHGTALLHREHLEIIPRWIDEHRDIFESGDGLEGINRIRRTTRTLADLSRIPDVRLDPKILLANERNYYHWIAMAMMFLRMALAKNPWMIQLGASMLSLWALLNGSLMYWWRTRQLKRGEVDHYGDWCGLFGSAIGGLLLVLYELSTLWE